MAWETKKEKIQHKIFIIFGKACVTNNLKKVILFSSALFQETKQSHNRIKRTGQNRLKVKPTWEHWERSFPHATLGLDFVSFVRRFFGRSELTPTFDFSASTSASPEPPTTPKKNQTHNPNSQLNKNPDFKNTQKHMQKLKNRNFIT
jgi:hypothetical protein